jgi:sulfate permease, SulP family
MLASQKKIISDRRRKPLFHGILPLDQSRNWADLAAGLTLAAVGVPEVMGYTKIIETAIAASFAFHSERSGVKIVGEVAGGLPHLGLPVVSWNDLPLVLSVSVSCFIVILAQGAATSRAYALRYRHRFGENRDLVGLAVANAAAGCSGTFVVNGSPTKTAIVDTAGGRECLASYHASQN